MRKFRTYMLAVLCSILLITPYRETIHAESEAKELERITYIDGDLRDGNIIYELKDNGNIYRITEYVEDNYKKVTSYIEVKQDDGSYKLVTKNQSVMTEHGIDITSFDYESSKVNHDTYTIANESLTLGNDLAEQDASISGSSSGWVYDGTVNGSNKITKYTIVFVTQLIIGVALPAGGVVSTATAIIAGDIAEYIVDRAIPTVYYSQAYYEKHALDVSWYMVTGSKWVTKFYANSSRTQFINSTTEIVYLDGYEE